MTNVINKYWLSIFILLSIFLLAGLFRFYGNDWDQGTHLHPDERFLTMVMNDMQLPSTVNEYLNVEVSGFNPRNVGYEFFVYGSMPLTINKAVALAWGNDGYSKLHLQGRAFVAMVDILTLGVVFLLSRLIRNRYKLSKNLPYWAAYLYAIAVLPIQLSHFFAVDLILSFFLILSLFFSTLFGFRLKWGYVFLSGGAFGLALASKLNGLYLLPLNIAVMGLVPLLEANSKYDLSKVGGANKSKEVWRRLLMICMVIVIFGLTAYLTVRVTDPTIFASSSWTN